MVIVMGQEKEVIQSGWMYVLSISIIYQYIYLFIFYLSIHHWEIDYRKIIENYRKFDGKLLLSYFTTVSEVFLELKAPLRPFQRFFGS